ncbi:hypothetical protein [Paenibacillus tyrfis]|uniref:hypothetical protein n=1 Tax=Paenibacillus tyrfis TaxID=1501230 RepID=UPI00118034A4|nr:hypothetical protein [Paenibacillus tyrfis]
MYRRHPPDDGNGAAEQPQSRDPTQAAGGKGPIEELQPTFDRSFLEQLLHHRRVPDENAARRRPRAPGHAGAAAGGRRESPIEELQRDV